MMPQSESLGTLLRQQRQRLNRQDVGLPSMGNGRSNGLTLAEVAVVAGVSNRWLGRLEQDALILTQFDALKRVLKTLQFGRKQQTTLLKLAGWQPESLADLPQKERRDQLQQAVNSIKQPAYVLDHLWNPVCFNSAAKQLFTHWLGKHARHHNLLDYLLLDPQSRFFIEDWPSQVAIVLQHFLQHIEPYRDNEAVAAFLQQRTQQSPLFAQHNQKYTHNEANVRPVLLGFYIENKGLRNYQRVALHVEDSPDWQLIMWLASPEA